MENSNHTSDQSQDPAITQQPVEQAPKPDPKGHGFGHFIWGSSLRRTVTLVVLAVVIGLGGFTAYMVSHGGHSTESYLANPSKVSASVSDACTTSHPPFSTFPVSLSDVSTITPLGHLDPPSHNFPVPHLYVNYAKQSNGNPVPVTFYAPGNITVSDISIIAKADDTNTGKSYYDYKVWFTACDGLLAGYFIHVYSLSPQLAAALGPIDTAQIANNVNGHESWGPGINVTDTNYQKFMNVKLNTGAVIGTAGGAANFTTNFDFGLSDARQTGQTADAAIWRPSDDNYVCALDYFSSNIRQSAYSKIGDFNSLSPAANQQCGSVYQDQNDTAQGVWVTKGANKTNQDIWSLNPHVISFIHNNIDQSKYMVGFSSDVQQSLGFPDNSAYLFTPSSTGKVNVPFNKVVSDGTTYCYQTVPQYGAPGQAGISFIVQMVSSTELQMGSLPSGVTCASSPSLWQFTKTVDFER